jgi:hypothetical protein
MIPSFAVVAAAHVFLARRRRVEGQLHEAGVRSALALAVQLAPEERDEPAALFFALASHGKALGGGWRFIPALLAMNHAARLGLRLNATASDFAVLYLPIATRSMTFEDVRAWFAERR